MNLHVGSVLCVVLFYLAVPSAMGASEHAPAAKQLDEFGLPLPAADTGIGTGIGAGAGAGVATTAAERWKREAVALAVADAPPALERRRARFGADEQANAYTAFGAAFAEAKVPDCLREDGLKFQPPRIGFIGFQGVLALPFVALAKVRGKCL